MTSFWIICALLVIVALVIVLPSLLANEPQSDIDRKKINKAVFDKKLAELDLDLINDLIDQDQYEIAKTDLQRSLIDDLDEQGHRVVRKSNKVLPIVVVILVPIVSVVTYLKISNGFESLSPEFLEQQQAQEQGQMQSVEKAIADLEKKLKQDSDNLDGWLMLGRSYLMTQQFDAAVNAFATANELTNGSNPNVLVSYGEAQGFAKGQRYDSSLGLFKKALQIDPGNERGLWYAGLASYQLEDYKSSVYYWERLLQQVPSDQGEVKSALQKYLNDAKQKAGIEIADLSTSTNEKSPSQQDKRSAARIIVNVSLSEKLEKKIVNSDTLFIYARAHNGPKMPLALVKMTAGDLPTTVTLDDSVSMMPTMTLSSMEQVEVIARISKSGQAIMQSGDIYGSVQPVSTNKSETVDVVISELAP